MDKKQSNTTKKKSIRKTLVRLFLFLILIAGGLTAYLYFFPKYLKKHEPEASVSQTTTQSLYSTDNLRRMLIFFPEAQSAAFNGRAAEIDYGTYIIPGLNGTETIVYQQKGESAICTSMTPQGLAVSNDYLFVSAYCYTGTHNSVIYVIDKKSHEFVKEIVIRNKSHVGGLAYDSIHDNLWIACMSGGIPQVNAISMKQIKEYSFQENYLPITYSQSYDLYAIARNSFLTYSNNALYIGYFTENSSSVLEKYDMNEDGTLKTQAPGSTLGLSGSLDAFTPIALPSDTRVINSKAQGVAFYKDMLLFSRSYGILPSSLQIYRNSLQKLLEESHMVTEIWFPEKMEQIYVDGNDLYVLFESAAYGYRFTSMTKVDRVLKLNLNTLLSGL